MWCGTDGGGGEWCVFDFDHIAICSAHCDLQCANYVRVFMTVLGRRFGF